MSTAAMSRPRSATPGAAGNGKVTFLGVLRSEFIKFTSLPSTIILISAAFVVMVGFGLMATIAVGASMGVMAESPEAMASMGPLEGLAPSLLISGLTFAQLIFGALAVMVMSSEFATGSARSTFVAVPTRQPVFWAKVLMLAIISAVVAFVSILVAYVVSKPFANTYNLPLEFASDSFQRSLWCGTLYVVMVAMIGIGLGALLRNSAGGIVVLAGLFFVLPLALQILMMWVDWVKDVVRFLPDQAALALTQAPGAEGALETWQSGLVVAAWIVIPLAAAALVLQRRDI